MSYTKRTTSQRRTNQRMRVDKRKLYRNANRGNQVCHGNSHLGKRNFKSRSFVSHRKHERNWLCKCAVDNLSLMRANLMRQENGNTTFSKDLTSMCFKTAIQIHQMYLDSILSCCCMLTLVARSLGKTIFAIICSHGNTL